jgi:chaperonin GroES
LLMVHVVLSYVTPSAFRQPSFRIRNSLDTNFLTPLKNHVLIRVERRQKESLGGLYLPQEELPKNLYGHIASVGTGSAHPISGKIVAPDVAVGQRVLYENYGVLDIKIGGVVHHLVAYNDVLLRCPKEASQFSSMECMRGCALIEIDPPISTSSSGLVTQTTSSAPHHAIGQGRVIKVGLPELDARGIDTLQPEVIPDDQVYFREYSARPVDLRLLMQQEQSSDVNSRKYVVVRTDDIVAKRFRD